MNSLFTVLLIVFITLKLAGVIFWSWLWVLSPLWIGLVWFLFVLFLVSIVGVGASVLTRKRNKF